MTKTFGALGVLLALCCTFSVHAVEVIGNETRVELTSAPTLIGTLGLSVQPVGIGTLEAVGPTAVFPITGGSVDDMSGAALVEHDGSGLLLSAGRDSLALLNFLIDTAQSTIFGDAVVIDDTNGTIEASALNDVPLFTFNAGLDLFLTGAAAGAIESLFGVPGLTGFEIGTAQLDLATAAPVPLPGAVWLFGSAVSLLMARRGLAA